MKSSERGRGAAGSPREKLRAESSAPPAIPATGDPEKNDHKKAAPPDGPPWDVPLLEAPLAFLDLEMTGLDPKRDRVVEICIERVRGIEMPERGRGAAGGSPHEGMRPEVEDRLHSLVRPEGGEIFSGNVHVHGIDADALAGAPTFAALADRIEALLGGAILVAHGAWWDVAFIEAEMARLHGGANRPVFKVPYYLDTLNLSRRAFGLPKHSLDALRAHFGIDAARAHRADADVHALREVFARSVAILEPTTPRDLWQVRIAERRAREHVLAQCTEALAAGREITLVYRARARPAEPLRMVLTAIDLGLDPPRVIGYQLPGRGRRELRADRILRIQTTETSETTETTEIATNVRTEPSQSATNSNPKPNARRDDDETKDPSGEA